MGRFKVGEAATPSVKAPASTATRKSRPPLKMVAAQGGAGALRAPQFAADADSWEEF